MIFLKFYRKNLINRQLDDLLLSYSLSLVSSICIRIMWSKAYLGRKINVSRIKLPSFDQSIWRLYLLGFLLMTSKLQELTAGITLCLRTFQIPPMIEPKRQTHEIKVKQLKTKGKGTNADKYHLLRDRAWWGWTHFTKSKDPGSSKRHHGCSWSRVVVMV